MAGGMRPGFAITMTKTPAAQLVRDGSHNNGSLLMLRLSCSHGLNDR
jgi:hypothetical protein